MKRAAVVCKDRGAAAATFVHVYKTRSVVWAHRVPTRCFFFFNFALLGIARNNSLALL